jgi:hypothetical protein
MHGCWRRTYRLKRRKNGHLHHDEGRQPDGFMESLWASIESSFRHSDNRQKNRLPILEECDEWAPEQPGRGVAQRISPAVLRHGHRGRDPGLLQIGSVGGSDAAHGAAGDPGPARSLRTRLLARRGNGSDADRRDVLAPAWPAADHREPGLELDRPGHPQGGPPGTQAGTGRTVADRSLHHEMDGFPATGRQIYQPDDTPYKTVSTLFWRGATGRYATSPVAYRT